MDLIAYQNEYLSILAKLKRNERLSVSEWSLLERYEEQLKLEEKLKKEYNMNNK